MRRGRGCWIGRRKMRMGGGVVFAGVVSWEREGERGSEGG